MSGSNTESEKDEETEDETIKETIEETAVAEEREREEDILEERIYTIPLSRAWITPRKRRATKATRLVQNFIQKHMKPETLILSTAVNERIWHRGIEKPPRKIRVRATRDKENTVTLYLAEED